MRVLGEGFTPEDEEDSALAEVSKVWAYQARYRVPLTKATAGTCHIKHCITSSLSITELAPGHCLLLAGSCNVVPVCQPLAM